MLARLILFLILVSLPISPAQAEYRSELGDLRVYLAVNIIVRTDPGAFDIPTYQETVTFYESVQKLLREDYVGAAADLDPLGYDVVAFNHIPTNETYYLLEERFFLRAQGAYCFNPKGKRLLNIQVPHPVGDDGTRPESIAIFMETESVFFQLSGCWRCVHPSPSDCTGTTVTCSEEPQAYRVSDAAHYAGGFFQAASDAVHDEVPDLISISVHGFGCNTPGEAQESSIVQISNGTTWNITNSLSTQLALAYNDIIFSDPINYPFQGAGSFQVTADEPQELDAVGCVSFSGGTNTQGRYINGALDPCEQYPPLPLSEERFLHLEQQISLRQQTPDQAGISWQITIDALMNLFEPVIWVDMEYAFVGTGSYFRPFGSLQSGNDAATAGQRILVKAGQGYDTAVVDKQVTVESHGGTAVIGAD